MQPACLATSQTAPPVLRSLLSGLVFFFLATLSQAVPPAAPTLMGTAARTATAQPVIDLWWDDTATDEDGFQIFMNEGGTGWFSLAIVGANVDSVSVPVSTGVIYQFSVRAVKLSSPSVISEASASSPTAGAIHTAFGQPGLSMVSVGDAFYMVLNDNATTEEGYEIETKLTSAGTFSVLGTIGPNTPVIFLGNGIFNASTSYQIRVRGYKGSPRSYTPYSATVTFTPPALPAPTNVVATRTGERSVGFTLTDNSLNEAGFQIDYRIAGTSTWSLVGTIAANATSITPIADFFDPSTSYQFRIRGFSGPAATPVSYSADSNIAAVSTIFNAPTTLTTTPITDTSIRLNWTDTSAIEGGFAVYARLAGSGSFALLDYTAANATTYLVTELEGATQYEFQVAGAYQSGAPSSRGILESARSNTATGTTRDIMTSPVYTEAVLGQPFQFDITATTGSSLTAATVTGLPPGLTFSASPPKITGTPTAAGVYECPVSLTFANGWIYNDTLTIRVLQPPAAGASPLGDLSLSAAQAVVDLNIAFTDPDVDSALQVTTTAGTMRFALFDSVTPLTVANFMSYVNAGDFTNTIFHRSVPGFVVQGGGFKAAAATGPTAFTKVVTRPPVQNEYSLSNVRGTVSMAKLGGDPNSATNQFFVSVDNNGPILNPQNGGFTVFGRVIDGDMSVADAINASPRGDYNVTIDGGATVFEDFPINGATAPDTMNNALSVTIQTITPTPRLTFAVNSNSNPSAVTTAVSGSSLTIQKVGSGSSIVVVRATDLDGNTFDQTFTVTVPYTFANWATDKNLPPGQDGPAQNPDFGSLDNLAEFVMMGDPLLPDDEAFAPVSGTHTDAASKRLSIAFNLRKNIDLIVKVEASSTLSPTGWSTIWHNETDGLGAANVLSATDQTTHHRVTVFDSEPPASPPSPKERFLRVTVSEKP